MLEQLEKLTYDISKVKILAISYLLRDVRKLIELLKAKCILIATSSVDSDIRKYIATQLLGD